MVNTGPIEPIEPPVRVPRAGGISAVVTPETDERLGNISGVRYLANPHSFANTEVLRFFAATPPPDKTGDDLGLELENGLGAPFTIYAELTRQLLLEASPTLEQRTQDVFDASWDRIIEAYVATWADGGTVLTTGTSPLGAIARVDQELDKSYLGRGIILASRYDVVIANNGGGLDNDDDTTGMLTTVNGTPIVASGAINPGFVYGIGALKILASTPKSYTVPKPLANTMVSVTEAVYTCAVDNLFRVKAATS